jgi:streptogramin lyase
MTGHEQLINELPYLVPSFSQAAPIANSVLVQPGFVVIDPSRPGVFGFSQANGGMVAVVRDPLGLEGKSQLLGVTRPVPGTQGPREVVLSPGGQYLYTGYTFNDAVFVHDVSEIIDVVTAASPTRARLRSSMPRCCWTTSNSWTTTLTSPWIPTTTIWWTQTMPKSRISRRDLLRR